MGIESHKLFCVIIILSARSLACARDDDGVARDCLIAHNVPSWKFIDKNLN